MPTTAASFGRSILALRHRDQVHSMEGHDESTLDPILSFDRHVSTLLLSLSSSDESLLSLSWIKKLLHSFVLISDDFHSLIFSKKLPNCPLLGRLLSDFFDRAIKALDVLNAVRDGLDRVRQYRAHLDIAISALTSNPNPNPNPNHSSPAQIQRAKKSLAELSVLILDQPGGGGGGSEVNPAHRNRSFNQDHGRTRNLRTLSWSVSRSWSAAKQLHAMGAGLSPPRPADISGTGGLASAIFTMSSVLVFVMWALVAAIPCQDRGIQTAHFAGHRSFPWAAAMAAMQEKVLEESKRERKSGGAGGLMREICRMEKGARNLMEILRAASSSTTTSEERENEVRELEDVNEGLKEELEGLERQVREVFHRILRSRTDGLDCIRE